MTSMEMVIAGPLEHPMPQEAVQPVPVWPLPVMMALILHCVLFLLASSLVPRLELPPAGEVVSVALYAAEPAADIAATAAPAHVSSPAIRQPAPSPPTEPRAKARPPKPIVAPPQPVAAKPTPASPSQAADPLQQSTQAAHQTSGPSGPTASAASPGERGGSADAVVPARPRYRDNPPPPYPEPARRRQIEGTVIVAALVNDDGRVDDLNVHASSGHGLLDEAALRAVKHWLFEPGRKGGTPMAMTVLVPVRFALR